MSCKQLLHYDPMSEVYTCLLQRYHEVMAEPVRKAAELAVSPHDQLLMWLHSSRNCGGSAGLLSSVHEPCMVPQVPCPQRHMMQKAI